MKTIAQISELSALLEKYRAARAKLEKMTWVCGAMLFFNGYNGHTADKEDAVIIRRVLVEKQEQTCHKLLSELERDGVDVEAERGELEAIVTTAEKRNEG